ncbi:MAG: response regulator, partial [Deltaproteobacteria bacterium]|nr:response regulator [Deltaproteobacteria bacterium]
PEKQGTKVAPEANQSSKLGKQFSQKHPLNILVAEDNALNQKLIQKILEKLGYTPHMVSNGREAVEANRFNDFDLIFMDVQMPGMDGIEASRIINKEINSPEKPKIIALTANVSEEVRETCLAAGMSDYTTKPLKINQLVTLLEKLHFQTH